VRTVDRLSGVRISHAETYRIVEEDRRPAARRTRGAPLFPTSGPEAARELQPLLAALTEQHMELVDHVSLEPGPGAPRRRGAPAAGPIELSVPLEPGEQAAVLVESDGLYTWHLPLPSAPARARRRGAPEPGRADFRIVVPPAPPVAPAQRGLIGDFVRGRIEAIVLRFVARLVVGKAMAHLERDVRTGLVVLDGPDPMAWTRVETLADVKLPRGRPARILLAVHGTFSSTTGGFGGLGAHPWGRGVLSSASRQYDAVVGYDHRTLSIDPLENASDLLQRLRAGTQRHPPQFDLVAHSRGGLVARSLTEQLLPGEDDWEAQVRRMVFVACANGGTLFASPGHWKAYVDVYTNLVMAATRLVDLAAPPLVGTIARGAVSGVGAFVKYLVGTALDPADVPGLAAMDPDGAFVRTLNETQPGQPDPAHSEMYVVTSDFEFGGQRTGPRELPPALLTFLADAVVDGVFKRAANDLVVDVASMGSIDPHAGEFVDDRLDFGVNGSVYHCNYFLREEVARALGRWLSLGLDEATVDAVRGQRMPAQVVTDVIEMSSQTGVRDAKEMLARSSSPYVVVSRPRREGGHRYAISHRELRDALASAPQYREVGVALDLHESDASEAMDAPEVMVAAMRPPPSRARRAAPRMARNAIVLAGGEVAGVLPGPGAVPDTADVLERRKRSRAKPKARAKARARKGKAPRRGAGPAHVHADMPPEVAVGRVVSISVELSAEPLLRAQSTTSKGGAIDPNRLDPDRPLTVQVIARENLEIAGDDRCDVPIPGPGDPPAQLLFDVRGVSEGAGEVWVLVRQGHPTLLLLALTPKVVGARARRTRARLSADGGVAGFGAAGWALPTLRVNERPVGGGVIFEYELDLLEGGVHPFSTNVLPGDRDAFVRRIYQDLENRWLATDEDAAAFLRDVRGYGGELFDQLFPEELQRMLWTNRNKLKHIRVLSTEPFVPWELVHLKNPATGRLPRDTIFMGQMGLVRWLVAATGPATTLRRREGKVRYLIPDYPDRWELAEPAAERAFLERTFAATGVEPHSGPVSKLLRSRGSFDILHFAGHGVATGGDTADAKILLQGRVDPDVPVGQDAYVQEYLLATTVRQEGDLADPAAAARPLVFLNACQVGRLGHQLSSLGGFADSFIKAGAGAFVSSLWNVGDEPAAEFGKTFYRRLKAGDTVSQAAVTAREKARAADDATWLAYVVYAHPDAKMQ
jgi:hypothetical protein